MGFVFVIFLFFLFLPKYKKKGTVRVFAFLPFTVAATDPEATGGLFLPGK